MNFVRKSLNKRFERYNEFQPQHYPCYFFGKWLGILGSSILLLGLVIKWLVFLKDYTAGFGNVIVWTVISIGALLFALGALCVLSIHYWTNRLMQETLENVDNPEQFLRQCKEMRMNRSTKSPESRSFCPLQSPATSPNFLSYQVPATHSVIINDSKIYTHTEQNDYRQATVCRADSKLSTVSNHLPVIGELESNRNSVIEIVDVLHNGSQQQINQAGISDSLSEMAIDNYFTTPSTSGMKISHHVRQSSTASMSICTAMPSTLCASAKIASNASSK